MSKKADAPAEWVSPDTLKPWPGNPRRNDGKPVEAVAKSIERFGFAAPIVARREDGEIIAGHTRWKAAQKLGLAKVPVRFMDLGDREAHLLALADNRQTELTPWDEPMLAEALSEFGLEDAELAGWDSEALGALADAVPDFGPLDPEGEEPAPDEVPEPPADPVTQPGDAWTLGDHRLVCGDSTKRHGALDYLAPILFTDPPYGIAYKAMRSGKRSIANDSSLDEARSVIEQAIALLDPVSAFLCCDWRSMAMVRDAMIGASFAPKACVVWDKERGVQNLDRFHKQHEFILYAGPYGGQPTQGGDVWRFRRDFEPDHPTPKPVPLVAHALRCASADGLVVFDPFAGSGSTLVAAEQVGMVCHAVEIDPAYCDVIVERWESLTGGKATRESH